MGKLQERNKVLEDMKEKSTTSIIEKYSKSVDMVEGLTADNMRLKQELQAYKEKTDDRFRGVEEQHQKEREENISANERLKQ
jgi:hypothetical protein